MSNSYFCPKCRQTLNENQFYKSNNLEKHPNGFLSECKKCTTMHINNWDPKTYLPILEDIDVPYVPKEWDKLLADHIKDNKTITSMTILGKYIAKMKLKQYLPYRWKDTDHLQRLEEKRIRESMERGGYSIQDIDTVIEESRNLEPKTPRPTLAEIDVQPQEEEEDHFSTIGPGPAETPLELSDEDIIYLRVKWGRSYKPEEWVQLERLYEEMMNSYDIQQAGHIDTLILLCKTSLKANQLLDIGDVDGAQKMLKMYDGLMKSGKFTAAQNKAENGEFVDSISELVALCEKDGFIPRYYVDGPQDKIDRVIQDMQDYTRNLIIEEMHLGALIERAVQQIEEEKVREAASDATDSPDEDEDERFENDLFNEETTELTDKDFEEFEDFEEEWSNAADDFFNSLLEEDD